jgi:hypothetical protein
MGEFSDVGGLDLLFVWMDSASAIGPNPDAPTGFKQLERNDGGNENLVLVEGPGTGRVLVTNDRPFQIYTTTNQTDSINWGWILNSGGPPPAVLSFVASSGPFDSTVSSDITPTLPGSIANDDLIVLTAYQNDASSGSIATPTNYTLLQSVVSGNSRLHMFYKVYAGEGDPTVDFTSSSGGVNHVLLAVFRTAGTPTSEASGTLAGNDPIEVPDYTEAAPTGFEIIATAMDSNGFSTTVVGITPGSFANIQSDNNSGASEGLSTLGWKANVSSGTISYDVDPQFSDTQSFYIRARIPEA